MKSITLKEITTFKIGGEPAGYKTFSSEEELKEIIKEAESKNLPLRILGGGSNILAKDEGLQIFVAHNKVEEIKYENENVKVGAGVLLDSLVDETTNKNLWGLENLKLIPGTVGGACVQNAGAYGVEIKDRLFSVTVFDIETKNVKEFKNIDCNFAYRDSIFKSNKNLVILYATFSLSKISKPILNYSELDELKDLPAQAGKINLASLEVANKVKEVRMSKLPDWQTLGTAGSFFKNSLIDENKYQKLLKDFPEIKSHKVDEKYKLYSGQIIELSGFKKGTKEGNVGLYKDNALVVVNHGDATYQEVKSFVKKIQDKVKEKFGIILEQEVEEL